MYICLCEAVTDEAVREAVANGVVEASELSETLGLGGNCGACLEAAQAIIDTCSASELSYAA